MTGEKERRNCFMQEETDDGSSHTYVWILPTCSRRRVSGERYHGMDFPSYLTRHVVPPSQVQFSSEYCGECRVSYDILKSYGSA